MTILRKIFGLKHERNTPPTIEEKRYSWNGFKLGQVIVAVPHPCREGFATGVIVGFKPDEQILIVRFNWSNLTATVEEVAVKNTRQVHKFLAWFMRCIVADTQESEKLFPPQ